MESVIAGRAIENELLGERIRRMGDEKPFLWWGSSKQAVPVPPPPPAATGGHGFLGRGACSGHFSPGGAPQQISCRPPPKRSPKTRCTDDPGARQKVAFLCGWPPQSVGAAAPLRCMLRLMRQHPLLLLQRHLSVEQKRHKGAIAAERHSLMGNSGATASFPIRNGQLAVFASIDHGSAACPGIHAARRSARSVSPETLRQPMRELFDSFCSGIARGGKLRHGHGGQFLSGDFQHKIRFFDMLSSPAFVHEPEGNGSIERFFRTFKEQFLWVPLRGAKRIGRCAA